MSLKSYQNGSIHHICLLESQKKWYKPEFTSLGWHIGCSSPLVPIMIQYPVLNIISCPANSMELYRRDRVHALWCPGLRHDEQQQGANDERRLAAHLERELAGEAILLHSRQIPGTRGDT